MSNTISTTVPLVYEQVKNELGRRIDQDWKPGTRVPPVRELARDLGVGLSSTHRAVKELIREGRLDARPGRGTFVIDASSPRRFSSSESVTKTKQVLVATSASSPDGMILSMIDGIEAGLADSPFQVTRYTFQKKKGVLRLPDEPDALILINPDGDRDIVFGDDQFMAVISTCTDVPVAMAGRYDVTTIDQEQGGFLAGEYFRTRGVCDVCFLGVSGDNVGIAYDKTSVARLVGFERGFGRQLPETYRLLGNFYGPRTGARFVKPYLELSPRPRGVFAVSDEVALGFISGAVAHGLEPGRDFDIVGFDAQAAARNLEEGPLTSVEVPAEQMGREAAELILSRATEIDQPVRRRGLGCTMFEGNTVRASILPGQ